MAKQYLSHSGQCLIFDGQKPIHFLCIIILLKKSNEKIYTYGIYGIEILQFVMF